MNKPSCYASQPNVISQAENDCGRCPFNGTCITETSPTQWADQNPPPEVQGLIEALQFYADENNYNHFPATSHPDCMDFVGFVEERVPGDKARQALETYRKAVRDLT